MLPKKDDTNTFGHDYAEECENNNFELSKMSSANNSIYKQNSEQQHHHHQRIISFDNNIYDNGKSFDETVEDDAKLNGDDTKHINNTVVLYEQYQKEFEDLKRDSSQIEREVSKVPGHCRHDIDRFHCHNFSFVIFFTILVALH